MKKETLRDSLIVAAAVIAGLLAVCGGGISEYANRPFWWNFWTVAAWVGFAACICGWIYLVRITKKR